MNKEQFETKYGKNAYVEMRQRIKKWADTHPEQKAAHSKKWAREHIEEEMVRMSTHNAERNRKGGDFYESYLEYNRTGLRSERLKVRNKHNKRWLKYKKIVAPLSQIHHEWIQGTSEYVGLALVETDQHMHGIVDVIKTLEGKITLFTEKGIRK